MKFLRNRPEWKTTIVGGATFSVLVELLTRATGNGAGITATEFNRTAPLLLRIHHMFWAIP